MSWSHRTPLPCTRGRWITRERSWENGEDRNGLASCWLPSPSFRHHWLLNYRILLNITLNLSRHLGSGKTEGKGLNLQPFCYQIWINFMFHFLINILAGRGGEDMHGFIFSGSSKKQFCLKTPSCFLILFTWPSSLPSEFFIILFSKHISICLSISQTLLETTWEQYSSGSALVNGA